VDEGTVEPEPKNFFSPSATSRRSRGGGFGSCRRAEWDPPGNLESPFRCSDRSFRLFGAGARPIAVGGKTILAPGAGKRRGAIRQSMPEGRASHHQRYWACQKVNPLLTLLFVPRGFFGAVVACGGHSDHGFVSGLAAVQAIPCGRHRE